MALIHSAYVKSDGSADLYDSTADATYTAEGSVTDGGSITDQSGTRYIASCPEQNTSGGRINCGTIDMAWDYTIVIRARPQAATGGDYHNLASVGGVYNDDTQLAIGWTALTTGFNYWYNTSTLYGTEGGGAFTLVANTVYTFIARGRSGNQQFLVCNPDIGGAGVDYVNMAGAQTLTNAASDGNQNLYLAGPAAFNLQSDGCAVDILGMLIYDEYISDALRDTIADDGFWAQFPATASVGITVTATGDIQ